MPEPDARDVEALAWMALYARRLGGSLRVEGVPDGLRELVAFMGLDHSLLGRTQFVTEMVTNGKTDTFAAVVAILAAIAGARDEIISSDDVGEAVNLNPVVVRRLLAPMRAAGIVESRRGVGGGWAIARDPAHLRLGEVYRALPSNAPPVAGPVVDVLARADAAFMAELDRATLADVLRSARES